MNHRGFGVYTIISIIALAALVIVLILPTKFNFQSRENTAKCIENMKMIKRAVGEYMQRKDKEYSGDVSKYMHLADGSYVVDNIDVSDLRQERLVDNKVGATCPESTSGDKYIIKAWWKKAEPGDKNKTTDGLALDANGAKIPVVTVTCPLIKKFPKHVLPAEE